MTALRQEDDAPRGFVTKAEHYAALREIDRLQDELAGYRDVLGECVSLHRYEAVNNFLRSVKGKGQGTGGQCTRIAIALVDAGSITFQRGVDLMKSNGDDPHNLLKVRICHLRRILKALEAPPKPIHNIRGVGYSMTPEARQWLRERVPEAFQNGGRL